jgi:hypothetical protein
LLEEPDVITLETSSAVAAVAARAVFTPYFLADFIFTLL